MDLSKRPRHTHRSLAQSRAEGESEAGPTRAERMDVLRQSRQLETVQRLLVSDSSKQGRDAGKPPAEVGGEALPRPDLPALTWLAETIEEQAQSSDEISAQLKAVLNQCLIMALAETDSVFDPPRLTNQAQSPEELLRALAAIVAQGGSQRHGLPLPGKAAAGRGEALPGPYPSPIEAEAPACQDKERIAPVDLRATAVAALIKRHGQRFAADITETPDGLRLETFADGAEITKDALGRVLEVKSAVGEALSFQYDDHGNLGSFQRTDCRGRPHSICRRDKHGVVVRDSSGRVRAAGESMSVDPHGCLSVHNHDGQMVSLDVVRGLHIERRRLSDLNGQLSTVTAVFAHDGFRMTTHFHESVREANSGPKAFGNERLSALRFYGRDGSLVEFSAEEELLSVRPVRVLPPGSLYVDPSWRGRRQGGTAWEAVQEYLELLL